MHAKKVCHKIMNNACQWMHNLRREALNTCILSAIEGQRLTVTGLGRAIDSPAKEKHCIKRADRLLSNEHLYREHRDIYQTMAQLIIGTIQRPVILIDWSDLDGSRTHFLLRAAIALDGRSQTLYEEVHTLKTKDKPSAHRLFMKRLKAILPTDCIPIVVTDAGFRTPWFREVEKQGWDWVGRIRNRHMIKQHKGSDWIDCKKFYPLATARAKYLGRVQLTRNTPLECELVVYKHRPKGRIDKNQFGQRAQRKHSKENAQREREPWLLATSIKINSKLAKQVQKIYATRMQIEEGFRDNKSTRYGLGFELNKSRTVKRLQILLLIAMLASVVLWILGLIAKNTKQHYQYQANTVKNRNVLSVIFLGLRVASDSRFIMNDNDIILAARSLWQMGRIHAEGW